MMRKIFLPIFIVLLFLLIFSGCSRRKNPLQTSIAGGGIFETSFDFSSLKNNVLNDPFGRTVLVYLPPGYQKGVAKSRKYPVLFLLHGFKENGSSYDHFYRIKITADQMISSGEIQPMVIVMPDGSGRFGGSFFTNSVFTDSSIFAGKYEDYITRELLTKVLYDFGTAVRGINYKVTTRDSTHIDTTKIDVKDTVCAADTTKHPPGCLGDSTKVLTHSFMIIDTLHIQVIDTTVTVSDSILLQQNLGISGHGNGGYGALRIATDYPLTFGSVSAMSAPLDFESILSLVPAFMDSNGVNPGGQGYHQINPDPNSLDRLSSFFFAMAVAFSPHDPENSDLSTFFQLTPSGKGVDLPFDSLRHTVTSVWNKWLDNDLKTRISRISTSDTSLNSLKIYIDCGGQDEFGFAGQAQAFYNVLVTKVPSGNVAFQIYSGYPGYSALNSSFVYDRLREVLKFHSDHFTAP